MTPTERKASHRVRRAPTSLLLTIGAAFLVMILPAGIAHATPQAPPDQGQEDVFDISLEDLAQVEYTTVFGASGYSQLVSEAPASVTIGTSAATPGSLTVGPSMRR